MRNGRKVLVVNHDFVDDVLPSSPNKVLRLGADCCQAGNLN